MEVPASTVAGLEAAAGGARATVLRRGFLLVLAAVVGAGSVGLLGVHTGVASADAGGYVLALRYPAVARAGLDTTWQVTVRHPGGFDGQLTLAVTGDWFDVFETQGFHPDAASSTRDGSRLYLTFDPPPGDVLVVDFDAYVQPSSQRGRTAEVSVVEGGHPVVTVPFRTRLLP